MSRLSSNPAPDSSDWRCSHAIQDNEDGVPRCLGNEEADTFPVNPDFRVLTDTKREDGLHALAEEKDAEEPGDIERGGHKREDDYRRTGNPRVPEDAADPGKEEKDA
ncbi:hypothetical protein NDU88_002153 [Pleurodeles waltl]|uniref:Uncharacterized protein n=1 Tax=Pleurodeles waltl TaxID=8319 RepID=A0AAV7UUS0_PLEWA|nr:hypothetical protein NDU88_002153 [Pleurodeles waltl]